MKGNFTIISLWTNLVKFKVYQNLDRSLISKAWKTNMFHRVRVQNRLDRMTNKFLSVTQRFVPMSINAMEIYCLYKCEIVQDSRRPCMWVCMNIFASLQHEERFSVQLMSAIYSAELMMFYGYSSKKQL